MKLIKARWNACQHISLQCFRTNRSFLLFLANIDVTRFRRGHPCRAPFTRLFRLSSPTSSRARWANNFMLSHGHSFLSLRACLSLGDAVTNALMFLTARWKTEFVKQLRLPPLLLVFWQSWFPECHSHSKHRHHARDTLYFNDDKGI